MITSRRLEHIGHELRGDWSSRLVLLVLSSVREIGDDGGDAACRGSFAGGDDDEEFHDSVIDVAGCGGLKNED